MKTSTKLIIIFFMCIPTSLLAYNFILKAEFKKGNVIRELEPRDKNIYTNKTGLPKFTHVAINGSLKVGNGGYEFWMAHLWIGPVDSTKKAGTGLEVIENLKDNMSAKVKNDTLFISFHVTGKFDRFSTTWNHESDIVKIYSDQVKSISVNYAEVTIGGNPGTADSLKLTLADGSSYNLQNLQLQKLIVNAKDNASLNIRQTNKISMLNYSLQNTSSLNVDENPVQHYLAVRVDSAAKIQISGKARVLQKQLH